MSTITGPQRPFTDGIDRLPSMAGGRSLLDVAATIIQWRWWIVAAAVVGALVGLALAAQVTPVYTSRAAILTQSGGSSSRLAGLASQFGVSVGSVQGGPGPQLYLNMLQSDNVLRRVVDSTYAFALDGVQHSTTLIDLLGEDEPTREARRALAVSKLRGLASASVDDQSGLLKLSVTTGSRELSYQIAQRLLAVLEAYNTELRQRQADAESRFIEATLAQQAGVLRNSEDRVQRFMSRNRLYENDPKLVLEYNRLSREMQMQQSVYTSLAQGFQQVRIDATRNTPTLSIVQDPLMADSPTPRPFGPLALAGGALAAALVLLLVLLMEYLAVVRASRPEPYARLRAAIEDAAEGALRFVPGYAARRANKP